jgi:hypothetical protein
MQRFSPKDLSPEERVFYRRWLGGVVATYGTILMMFGALFAYQVMVAPTPIQALEEPADAIGPAPIRQAVKYD